MHAIIETGGKQYRVAPGDVVRVEKLAGEVGSEIELPLRAVFKGEGELVVGADLGQATVKGTIMAMAAARRFWSSSSSARSSTSEPSDIARTSPR